LSEAAKYSVGALSGVALYGWLLLAGRPRRSPARQLSLDGMAPPAAV
jgi:hypothetical protein